MPSRSPRMRPPLRNADAAPVPRPLPRDADEALQKLVAGNRAFARMADAAMRGEHAVMQLDPGELGFGSDPGVAPAQRPFAAVLGCADARVPVEMVFQQRSNDLFVVRVAGNGIGLGGLGSFRYAAANFADSLRLIVVLGHSHCGAVTAAVDAFLRPRDYLPLATNFPLRSLVDGILVSVRAASLALEKAHGPAVAGGPGYRAALVEASVVVNAALAAYSLERELAPQGYGVVFGCYDIASGRLFLPVDGAARRRGTELVRAPRDEQGFRRLGERVATSAYMAKLLGEGRPAGKR
jgi:carbonic anhydrase